MLQPTKSQRVSHDLVTKQQGKASKGTVCQGGGREGSVQQLFSRLSPRP